MHQNSGSQRRQLFPPLISCARMTALLLVGLLTCGAASSAAPVGEKRSAEAYRWRPVAIGAGGFITGFSSDPGGKTRVVRTDVYGAYIWLETEQRWAQLVTSATMPRERLQQAGAAGGVFEIVVAPSKPDRIYMAVDGYVYRSDNRGGTFVRTSATYPFPLKFDANSYYRQDGPFLAVGPSDPDLVLFGSPLNGLFRSTDAGKTWERAIGVPPAREVKQGLPPDQQPPPLIWFERTASGMSGRIWATSRGQGVFVSQDRGATFTPLLPATSPQPLNLRQGAFAADGTFFGVDDFAKKVWRYRDGAWDDLTARPGLSPRVFSTVAIDPYSPALYVFDVAGRAFVTLDGGENWQRVLNSQEVGEGDPPWLHVANIPYFATAQVVFDPVVRNRLWTMSGVGVFYADVPPERNLIRWISKTRGIEELVAADVISRPGRPPMFAAYDFGIHVREDLDSFSTGYGPKERVLIAAEQIDWSPSDLDFVVTNASDTRTCCTEDGDSVLAGYTLDNGKTWAKFPTLPQPPNTKPDDPWRMSFGTIAVASNNTSNIVWMPTFNRAPFYTKDRGKTWTKVDFGINALSANTGSHEHKWLLRKTVAADRVNPDVFYLYHSGTRENPNLQGLWKTANGGDTWSHIFKGEIAPASNHAAKLRAVPTKAGHLFFTSAVRWGSDKWLRRSTDGGVTWSIVGGVDQVDDVGFGKPAKAASYPAIYISGRYRGQYGIWRSLDEAATWQRIGDFAVGSLDQVGIVEGDKNVFGRVYLGYTGSGWKYGEPKACEPAPYRFPDDQECFAVR